MEVKEYFKCSSSAVHAGIGLENCNGIPARATFWRKHRQILLQILGEQALLRRGLKLSQYEPLERMLERLSMLNLISENYLSFVCGGQACWQAE